MSSAGATEKGSDNEGRTLSLRIARGVSVLTFPPLVALPVFLVLTLAIPGTAGLFLVVSTTMAFGVAWPITVSGLLISRRNPQGVEGPQERSTLLAWGVLGYAIGVGVLVVVGSPILVTLLMFCYATNTAVMFVVNLRWRASVHAMGIAGPTIALAFGFGGPGVLLSLLLPVVGWSRIRLRAHTLSQVVVGAALGYVLTGTQIALGLRWLR